MEHRQGSFHCGRKVAFMLTLSNIEIAVLPLQTVQSRYQGKKRNFSHELILLGYRLREIEKNPSQVRWRAPLFGNNRRGPHCPAVGNNTHSLLRLELSEGCRRHVRQYGHKTSANHLRELITPLIRSTLFSSPTFAAFNVG
ncbi:uncharacterized protein LOC143179119 [Calliopsis andreniformis]|uniref:uncharacterized protein LOC143179119 n=1 Tax=Calliopsis andreniformis TaxID=337506 RepID=UPI003FCE3A7E